MADEYKNEISEAAKQAFESALTAYALWKKRWYPEMTLNSPEYNESIKQYREFQKFLHIAFKEHHPFVKLLKDTHKIELIDNKNVTIESQKPVSVLDTLLKGREKKPIPFTQSFFGLEEKFIRDKNKIKEDKTSIHSILKKNRK